MKRLEEISIIRPIVIVLCVVMHSFTIYGGGWPLPNNIQLIATYTWIQRLTYSFMLETFVFISGYVFAFQIYGLCKTFTLKGIAKKKFKRLIIPSLIFSVLNLVIFDFYSNGCSAIDLIYKIFCGVGHMWFLPMLFLCFIFSYLIVKLKIKEEFKLLLLLLISVLSIIPLPFRVSQTMYYLLFFYLGMYCYNNKNYITNKFANKSNIVKLLIVFVVTFIVGTIFRDKLFMLNKEETNVIVKIFILIAAKILMIAYSLIGTILLYLIVMYFLKLGNKPLTILLKSNEICMGVFVIHHFLLQYIYYRTNIPTVLGTYWLPWFSFIFVLFLSIVISVGLKKTKIGNFLLG